MGVLCKLCTADPWLVIGLRSLVADVLLVLSLRRFPFGKEAFTVLGVLTGVLFCSLQGICSGISCRDLLTGIAALTFANVDPVLNPICVLIFLGECPCWFSIINAVLVLLTVTLYQSASHTDSKRL